MQFNLQLTPMCVKNFEKTPAIQFKLRMCCEIKGGQGSRTAFFATLTQHD